MTAKKEKQILVFTIAGEEMGVELAGVREVVRLQEIHALPQAPSFVEGVINLRGHIIAVIDLRKRFALTPSDDASKSRIIICKIQRFIVGVIVDSVIKVTQIPEAEIEPVPEFFANKSMEGCVTGVGRMQDRVVILLDLANVLNKEEAETLSRNSVPKPAA